MVEDGQGNLEQFWRWKTTSEDFSRWRVFTPSDLSDEGVYEHQGRDGPEYIYLRHLHVHNITDEHSKDQGSKSIYDFAWFTW